jgi:hypothetical protein
MKSILSILALTALIVTSSFTIENQQQLNHQQSATSSFNYLRVHRQGKTISLTWSVNDPSILQFVVERSYDAEYFEEATTQNFNGASSYKFNDAGFFPGTIYYRITAVKSDGTTETSEIQSVRIVQRG